MNDSASARSTEIRTTAQSQSAGHAQEPPDAPLLLEVSDLHVSFGVSAQAPAVRGVDLAMRHGEIVALVGESGSGRSTIGTTLMRLFPPETKVRITGRALFHGPNLPTCDLLELPERDMRRIRGNSIAMIFQEPLSSLNPIFTVGSQIVEALRSHQSMSRKQAQAEAEELLSLLGFPNPGKALASYPHQISGGMRQRIMIAMALSCDPSLLIADEPTTALDVTIQAQIIELLLRLQRRTGMAILFITHDLNLVAHIADRVVVVYAGQVVEAAQTEEIFARPLMPYTQALMQAVPDLGCSSLPDYRLEPIPGQAPEPVALPAGCAFHPRCSHCIPSICADRSPDLESLPNHQVRCARWRDLQPGTER